VTEGATLQNLTLRVGPALKAKVVSGRVVWKSGDPVKNGQISVYDGNRYVRSIKADNKGRFSFEVYGDFKYSIMAQVSGEREGESDRVAVTNESTNLTLVVKPK